MRSLRPGRLTLIKKSTILYRIARRESVRSQLPLDRPKDVRINSEQLTFTRSIRHRGVDNTLRKQSHDALTTDAQHGRTVTGLNPSTGHRSRRRRAIRIGLGTKVTEGNVQDDPSRVARAPLSLTLPSSLSPFLFLCLASTLWTRCFVDGAPPRCTKT